jgi:glycosyltransferase involved in cell wall biosynthesis
MLVSVVIPNCNYAAYLGRTIESIVEQTYAAIELLVIDDGSSDDSKELIDRLAREHEKRFQNVESIFLSENGGKLRALNHALPKAKGEIILILDADDCLRPDCLTLTVEQLLASHASNPRVGFVYTDCWLVDSSDTILSRGISTSFDPVLIETSSYIPECAPTLARAIKDVLPFDESIKVGTKHHKWKRIVAAGWEGTYLEEPLFYYRMHDRNISGIGQKVLADRKSYNFGLHILSGYWPTS